MCNPETNSENFYMNKIYKINKILNMKKWSVDPWPHITAKLTPTSPGFGLDESLTDQPTDVEIV